MDCVNNVEDYRWTCSPNMCETVGRESVRLSKIFRRILLYNHLWYTFWNFSVFFQTFNIISWSHILKLSNRKCTTSFFLGFVNIVLVFVSPYFTIWTCIHLSIVVLHLHWILQLMTYFQLIIGLPGTLEGRSRLPFSTTFARLIQQSGRNI